jgi:two-component system, NtrC family, nitrogen regulation sensor histidine kinase GlnL
VRREVGRIDALVGQLLKLAGPGRPAFGLVRVHEALRDALRLMQPATRQRRIEEVVLLEAVNDRVEGDAPQLGQAFLNLLLNAVEAMEEGGRLLVRTEVVVATEHISRLEPGGRERQLQVEIGDTGPGMDPAVLKRLFTPFLTTKPGGTGLGLVITRRIVFEHHGTMKVETRPGAGTTFRVLLPLLRQD